MSQEQQPTTKTTKPKKVKVEKVEITEQPTTKNKLVKGSQEAKEHMAKIRAMRKKK